MEILIVLCFLFCIFSIISLICAIIDKNFSILLAPFIAIFGGCLFSVFFFLFIYVMFIIIPQIVNKLFQ